MEITSKSPAPEVKQAALNEQEAARYTGMSVSFLRRARLRAHLDGRASGPPVCKVGRSVRYLITDLDAWLESNREGTDS